MKVGFVLAETVDGRFVPWESFLDWESYVDYYCLALMRRGHSCVKYVPSIEAERVTTHEHKFGHTIKRIPVHHPILNPRWLGRRTMRETGTSTTAHQLQGLGFTFRLLKEARTDRVEILHYSSYYSSFFVPAFLMRTVVPIVAQYSGGAFPGRAFAEALWRAFLTPSFFTSSLILVGDYRSELQSLRSQAGAAPAKIRSFDSPIVDTSLFRPYPREEAVLHTGFDWHFPTIISTTFIPKGRSGFLAKDPFALVSLVAEMNRIWSRRATLLIAGFGPGMEDLRDHARSEGVDEQVKLLGKVKHDLLPKLYSASDLVFVPYPFEKLNEGSVTFEAFACGRPVAGWRRTNLTPVEQKGGFLIDMDPKRGAVQLISRLDDSNYMVLKGEEGRRAAAGVSLEVAGMKLETYYREQSRRYSRGP